MPAAGLASALMFDLTPQDSKEDKNVVADVIDRSKVYGDRQKCT